MANSWLRPSILLLHWILILPVLMAHYLDKVGDSFSIKSKLTPKEEQQAAASLHSQQQLFKRIQDTNSNIRQGQNQAQLKVLRKLQSEYKQYALPEPQMTVDKLNEKPRYGRPSQYFKEYQLLSYGADGTAQRYAFNDAFMERFAKRLDSAHSLATSGVKKHGRVQSNIPVSKLLAPQQSSSLYASPAARRRRLETPLQQGGEGRQFRQAYKDRMPDQSVGQLRVKFGQNWMWCTGTVIDVKKESLQTEKARFSFQSKITIFVYVLTGGHCVYLDELPSDELANSVPMTDARRFGSEFRFQNYLLHDVNEFEQVWVPFYVRSSARADDFAVIKFSYTVKRKDQWSVIEGHYSGGSVVPRFEGGIMKHKFSELSLVGMYDGVKLRVDHVKPISEQQKKEWYKDTLTNPTVLRNYVLAPLYTLPGVSGAPIFQSRDSKQIIAVHSAALGGKYSLHALILEEQSLFIEVFTSDELDMLSMQAQKGEKVKEVGKHAFLEQKTEKKRGASSAHTGLRTSSLKNEWYLGQDMHVENTYTMQFLAMIIGMFCMVSICVAIGSGICGFVGSCFYLQFNKRQAGQGQTFF